MTRKVREIQDLVIDEISLVDKGANQHATVTIAKSADGEKENYMDIYDEQGNPLDPDALELGDVVYDADGDAYEIQADDDDNDEVEYEEERELAVAKSLSSPFTRRESRGPVAKGFAQGLREELSKALTDRDRDEVINKAFGQIEALTEATEIAKRAAEQERDIRLTQEYAEIAKSYDVPGLAYEDLGVVLKHCAENLSREDCEVIAKALQFASDAGDVLYSEIGSVGGGDNSDVLDSVNAHVDGYVSKGGGFSREELVSEVFAQNPEAYDQYLAERG